MADLAGRQHGLVSWRQLSDLGVSRGRLRTLLDWGMLTRIDRGVFCLPGAPPSWERRVMAAVLTPGAPLVASHRTALRLWGLRTGFDEVEVSVRLPAKRDLPGVLVHRSVDLEPVDVCIRDGIPTTTIERTLCDAGLIFLDGEVRRFVEHSVATGLVTPSRLIDIRRRVSEHGRNGVVRLDLAIEGLPRVEGVESGPELRLLRLLLDAGLPRPEVQHAVEVGGRTYRLDLAYPEVRLGLEYDGFEFHSGLEAFTSDRRRQNHLIDAGWVIRRYTHGDLRDRPGGVVAEVRSFLARHQPPNP